eukprot:Phypoly_transcript_05873.p1 GENE.Phypoly_transcript_05873~~Phypoly_transcript_05873.p1  ORF type:complete len:177 (+),score=26.63 Phypoly_transcript_05873:236-766(+)
MNRTLGIVLFVCCCVVGSANPARKIALDFSAEHTQRAVREYGPAFAQRTARDVMLLDSSSSSFDTAIPCYAHPCTDVGGVCRENSITTRRDPLCVNNTFCSTSSGLCESILLGFNQTCNPANDGDDCISGFCEPAANGTHVCTERFGPGSPCTSDLQCYWNNGTAIIRECSNSKYE